MGLGDILFAVGFTFVCMSYFGTFYYLLEQGTSTNSFGMFALVGFFGIFLCLGLGGIECIIFVFSIFKRE